MPILSSAQNTFLFKVEVNAMSSGLVYIFPQEKQVPLYSVVQVSLMFSLGRWGKWKTFYCLKLGTLRSRSQCAFTRRPFGLSHHKCCLRPQPQGLCVCYRPNFNLSFLKCFCTNPCKQ